MIYITDILMGSRSREMSNGTSI